MSMVGVGDDADGGDGDAHHGWSGHPGGGVGGVTALSRCQLCLTNYYHCSSVKIL